MACTRSFEKERRTEKRYMIISRMIPESATSLVSHTWRARLPSYRIFDVGSPTGRAWSAAELRRKSFRDLHTLWYVLLRERNLVATQLESYRRASVPRGIVGSVEKRAFQVRQRGRSYIYNGLGPVLTRFLSLEVSQEHGANQVCHQ